MTTHSKGSYVAFRSGRNAPTRKELARRKYIAEECRKFCDEPFPNGAVVERDKAGNDVFVMDIRTRRATT
jgi:hypothetical protein